MSEKYNIEELIVRFLQQDINEDELRYLKSWLEEDVEHKSYFFELKGISDSSRRSFFSKEGLNETSWQKMYARIEKLQEKEPSRDKLRTRNLWISWVKCSDRHTGCRIRLGNSCILWKGRIFLPGGRKCSI